MIFIVMLVKNQTKNLVNFKESFKTFDYVVSQKDKNKIIKDVTEMFDDGFRLCDWEKEKMQELMRLNALEAAEKRATKKAFRKGKQEGIIFTIKSMIKENCSFDFISKITGKSII